MLVHPHIHTHTASKQMYYFGSVKKINRRKYENDCSGRYYFIQVFSEDMTLRLGPE